VKSAHSISAVVPIYNERSALPSVVHDIDRFLAGHFEDYEIIIVESGSTDGTAEACDALAARMPRGRVHHEGQRNGFGSAVRAGYALATKEWVWPLVADMPFPLDAIERAIPYFDTHGSVLSYRSEDPRSRYRRFQSRVFNSAARLLLGVRVRHINSAFKVTRTSVVRSMDLTSNGWLIDAELVMRLEEMGVAWTEIPVKVVTRSVGRSTVGPAAVIKTALELVALAARRGKR
jgi:glycosyltransferase involved in cell wall biosynthesis